MPLDVNCPKCTHVFPVTEAKHPFGVQCPGCDVELTAEFRKHPIPVPGQPHYELLVSIGRPPGAAGVAQDGKKALPLDDEDGKKRRGGSMLMVFLAGVGALLVTLAGLGATGYVLFFTDFGRDDDTAGYSGSPSRSGGSSRQGNNPRPGGNNPNPGDNNPNPGDPFKQPKKVDKFDLRPVGGPFRPISPPPNLPAGDGTLEVDFGGRAEAVTVAGGGRYIVAHIRSRGLLGVYEATKGQMIGGIEADRGDVKLAGGASRVVAYSGDSKVFRVYTLGDAGLTRDYDATTDMFFPAHGIAMGNRTNGPLLACDPFGEVFLYEVGPSGLKEVEGARKKPGVHAGVLKAFPDGTGFVTYDAHNQSSVRVLTVANRDWKVTNTRFGIAPGLDNLLYGNGTVVDRNGREQKIGSAGAGSGTWFLPGVHGSYFLKIAPATIGTGPRAKKTMTVTVHMNRNSATPVPGTPTLTGVPDFDGLVDGFGGKIIDTIDQHLFLIPDAKTLAVLKADRTRLVLRKIQLP